MGKIVIALALASSLFAQDGLTIPSGHPRLFWTPTKLSQAQAWAVNTGYAGLTAQPRPLDPYDVLFACYVLNNGTACATLINAAVSFNATDYTVSSSNTMRTNGEWIMLTYDWLYDQLTPAQRATIVTNWNLWQSTQDQPSKFPSLSHPTNNFFNSYVRNDVELGIVSAGDNPSSTSFLDYGLVSRWGAVTNFTLLSGTGQLGAAGYGLFNQEGGGEYGRYSLNYYSILLPSLRLLGRDIGQETTAFKAGVFQTIYNTMPTNTTSRGMRDLFTWADDEVWSTGANCSWTSHNGVGGHGGCGASSQYYGDFMQSAANLWPSTSVGKLARQWISDVNPAIGSLHLSTDPGGSAQAYSTLPLDYYSSGAQLMYSRNRWAPDATEVLWQMGLNSGGSGHPHQDAGTFQVFRKGVNLIRETVGYGNGVESVAGYGGVGTTDVGIGFAHNVPLVGGQAAINVFSACSNGRGTVTRLESKSGYGFAVVDLTGAYKNTVCDAGHPSRQNSYVVSLVRELYYFRGLDTMVVVDRYQTDSASRNTTFTSHCETNPTINNNTISCIDGSQQAKYTALAPLLPSIAVVAENANGATAANWQYRIEVTNPNPGNMVSYSIQAVQFCDAGACSLTPLLSDSNPGDPTTGTFTVTLNGSNGLTIAKGVASAGGSITISGSTTSLGPDVQSMAITDSGPVWDTGPALSTSPSSVIIVAGSAISLVASGGTSPYSWSASRGSITSGSGSTFTTSFPDIGTYLIDVTDADGTMVSVPISVLAHMPSVATVGHVQVTGRAQIR